MNQKPGISQELVTKRDLLTALAMVSEIVSAQNEFLITLTESLSKSGSIQDPSRYFADLRALLKSSQPLTTFVSMLLTQVTEPSLPGEPESGE